MRSTETRFSTFRHYNLLRKEYYTKYNEDEQSFECLREKEESRNFHITSFLIVSVLDQLSVLAS